MSRPERPTSDANSPPPIQPLSPIIVAGNELTLFEESAPCIAALVADIRQAQRRVWLESYIIDDPGRAVAEALLERAAAGVDVRLMYDAIGCIYMPQAYFDRLNAGGVKVHAFHSIRDWLWKFRLLRFLNRRNHRKLVVVDDRASYFGGMNLVDLCGVDSVGDLKERHLPPSAGWRELHIRLVGPKQADIAEEMDRLWRWRNRQRIPKGLAWHVGQMLDSCNDAIHFFASRPGRRNRRIVRIFGPLIRRAEREIVLSMAYFLPDGLVLRELLRARRRGVQVRVVVPGASDVKLVQWATRHLCRRLLARGIRIYERQDFMLHSKVMVIDGRWTVVGSANLDPRSLRINLEFLAVIFSSTLAAAATSFCRREVRHSRRLRLSELRRRPWWQRLRDRMAWSLRRWL